VAHRRTASVILDVDSAPIEGEPARATGSGAAGNGHQPKAEWNGHDNALICHPLITSVAQTGDVPDARLRAGSVGPADGAPDVIRDVVGRAQNSFCAVTMVRIDAGFPSAALLAGLKARRIGHVSRLKANRVLYRLAGPHMVGPVSRRPAKPRMWLRELRWQAESWQEESRDKPRRVVLVMKKRADDAACDRFFLVSLIEWTRKLRHAVPRGAGPQASGEIGCERGKAAGQMGEVRDMSAPAFAIVARTNGATWLIPRPTAQNRSGTAGR